MFQGFYNLTSGVLTQTRKLNVISNNMANVTTPGFRKDTYTETTFREEMIYRTGNTSKVGTVPVGQMNRIVTGGGTITNYGQGSISETTGTLDFALPQKGFFAIQSPNGTVYTRNGSFCLDQEGYLYLEGVGRVLGTDGPIRLGTDRISADGKGNLYAEETGQYLGHLRVVDFQNYETDLTKAEGDVFTATGNGQDINADVSWKSLENSNVDTIQEMTEMMSAQRAMQSAAQVLKMYDQLAGKIVQLGPV